MKDNSETRKKVQKALLLMTEGRSERQAAKEAGISRTSLHRYMAAGCLPDGPIWPDQVSEQVETDNGNGNNEPPGGPDVGQTIKQLMGGSTDSQEPGPLPAQRDELGRFLPGHSIRPKYLQSAREAKEMLANYAPFVASILIKVFGNLPVDRPDLILAYAKEIFDRGLGKPTQTVQMNEEHVGAEYNFFQAVICNGDEQTIREAQALAVRMESYARDNGGASVRGSMAIIPPPGGTLNFANTRRDGQVSEAHNLDASTAREE
ncbi:MAG: hypothetical protein QUS09_05725 [Methanotrichaceae archaeon]|nr:hypothetical protein [Methanotrichaceae archaeon]